MTKQDIKLFRKFLKQNNLLGIYLYNLRNDDSSRLKPLITSTDLTMISYTEPNALLLYAFDWSKYDTYQTQWNIIYREYKKNLNSAIEK